MRLENVEFKNRFETNILLEYILRFEVLKNSILAKDSQGSAN